VTSVGGNCERNKKTKAMERNKTKYYTDEEQERKLIKQETQHINEPLIDINHRRIEHRNDKITTTWG